MFSGSRLEAGLQENRITSDPPVDRAAPPRFRVREATSEEIERDVLPLWHSGMSDLKIVERIQARHDWLYRQAPYGPLRTWTVRDLGTGQVVGAGSILPVEFEFAGRPLRGGMLVDFIVTPSARTAGPAVMLQRELARQCRQNGFDFLFGYPNRRAWPVLARAGYRVLSGTREWVRPIDRRAATIRSALEERLRGVSGGRLPRPLVRVAAAFGAFCFREGFSAIDATVRLACAVTGHRLSIAPMDGPPPMLTKRRMAPIRRREDLPYLDWRFRRHPTHANQIVRIERRGQVLAWAIVRKADDRAEVQQVAVPSASELPGRLLFLALPGLLARAGYRRMSASLSGRPMFDAMTRGALYVQRDEQRNVVLHVSPEIAAELSAALWRPEYWSLLAGELDG